MTRPVPQPRVEPSPTDHWAILPTELFAEPLATFGAGSVTRPPARRAKRSRGAKPTSLPAGTVVDKYRIEGLLGAGAFAAVYRVTHLLLDAPFALKLLHRRVMQKNPHAVAMLLGEARHLARLDHPNIARVFDVTSDGDVAYIVLEFVPGRSLADAIRQRRMEPSLALRVALDVCRGLQAALAHGVIHRDVKPSNIVLTPGGHSKLVDLGFAVSSTGAGDGTFQPSLAGTPHYMSPEQADCAPGVDFRSDIYSLGITLHHAILGRVPFRYASVEDLRAHRRTGPLALPPDMTVGRYQQVGELLQWMTAPEPSQRPRSYQDLERAILTLLGS